MTEDLVVRIDALLEEEFRHRWLLQDLLPTGAGMLFHGMRGIGKSLLAQALAISILNEGHFFGTWKTHKRGGVLYVQADLPPVMQKDRVQRLMSKYPWLRDQPLHFYFPASLDITRMDEEEELARYLQELEPCLVIWDVLRKIHHHKEATHVPGLVYGSTRRIFPDSGHFYIHHDKKWTKDRAEGYLDPSEDFSGVGPWLDLVVSGWHITEQSKGQWALETTKNNCGAEVGKLLLKRDPETLLPVLKLPRVHDEIARWKAMHGANPRRLKPRERDRLYQHLMSSFVGTSSTVEKLVKEA